MHRWMAIALVVTAMACGQESPRVPHRQPRTRQAVSQPIRQVAQQPAQPAVPPLAAQVAEEVPTQEVMTVPEPQLAIIAGLRRALFNLTMRSPAAREQLALYDRMAVAARYEDGGNVRAVNVPERTPFFFVAANTEPLSEVPEEGMRIFAEFRCYPIPVLLLRDSTATELAKGIGLAHEIEHARDCLLNDEPESAPLSPTWLLGELHAHVLVSQVLSEAVGDRWMPLVMSARRRRQAILDAQGASVAASAVGFTPEDILGIQQLLATDDRVSVGLMLSQLDIESNVANILTNTTRVGVPADQQRRFIIGMMEQFYRQQLEPPRRSL